MRINLLFFGKTLKHLFQRKTKSVTEIPTLVIGVPRLKKDEQGYELCIACIMCELLCPFNAIKIIPAATSKEMQTKQPFRRRKPSEFSVDLMKCTFCKICEEICPTNAIILTENLPDVTSSKNEQIYDKQQLFSQ